MAIGAPEEPAFLFLSNVLKEYQLNIDRQISAAPRCNIKAKRLISQFTGRSKLLWSPMGEIWIMAERTRAQL